MGIALALQYILPHRLLSRVVYYATRWTWRPWKNWLIGTIVRRYRVDMSEAEHANALSYASFNAFFTRALKPGARPLARRADAILCPADGLVSRCGTIRDGRIIQAKGHDFSLADFLGEETVASTFAQGSFLTVYLSPRDYHRVHMPLTGTLRRTVHVPGRLFSVAPFTVAAVPRLFARNERLICHFDSATGPFVVAMVGAMLVSGIETVWSGVEIPPHARSVVRHDWSSANIQPQRGAEIARFNMGSTVIVLLPPDSGRLRDDLAIDSPIHVGQDIGTANSAVGHISSP